MNGYHTSGIICHMSCVVCVNHNYKKIIKISNPALSLNYSSKTIYETFKNLLLQTTFVVKVCSNGGATYIIGEVMAKENLNTKILMQTFENILLKNYSIKFLDVAQTNSPWVCVIKVCSNGGTTYIISEIIAKGHLNIAKFIANL